MIIDNPLKNIGNTPLVKLTALTKKFNSNIYVKIESCNPGGSVKDRIAKAMIEDAEKRNLLNNESVVIEPTSGNTGIGLAMVCAIKNYKCIIIMPDNVSEERKEILKLYGAEVILTPAKHKMQGAIKKAEEIKEKYPNSYIPFQFKNPANPEIHRQTTSREILNDLDRDIDIFISGVGSGGTITGVGEVLKKEIPGIKIIAVEPENSAIISGEQAGSHKIQGIGAGFIPEILNTNIIDDIIIVSDNSAFETSKLLSSEEGIISGISAGANVYAALQLANLHPDKKMNILTFIPDSGERYLSQFTDKK